MCKHLTRSRSISEGGRGVQLRSFNITELSAVGVILHPCYALPADTYYRRDRCPILEIKAMDGYYFSHIAFGHAGSYLYAWSYGSGSGQRHAHAAYVWRVKPDGTQEQQEFARRSSQQSQGRQLQENDASDSLVTRVHFERYPTVCHVSHHALLADHYVEHVQRQSLLFVALSALRRVHSPHSRQGFLSLAAFRRRQI